ncbi:ribosome production factor 2 homolog [Centruroides sculpturatus]|uniref:ribosome production factor 2 homolog n=1 Tax=Centruroides sculpturatus TaxID=218467 RepID=UPI000C6E32DA|nr:ribosome production factor 2 homolog [Centruroides sculpturatus]
MSAIRDISKPKTRRGKKFLENKSPKVIENVKTTLFIRGSTANNTVLTAMKNLNSLKKPHGVFFNRKNEMRPFEDIIPIETFCQKNDASLFMFGSHNKKRPNNLIIGRMYDFHLLDMFELGVEKFKSLEDFKVPKISCSTKPLLLFVGELFEDPIYQRLKNLLIDFFRGPEISMIRLQGLEHVIMITADDGKLYFRSYRIVMKKSGMKTPYIELIEIGPSLDMVLRRNKMASDDFFKLARKQPKVLKPKKVKNIKKNVFGSKLGRIHMKRQNFKQLNTRKMKGLKKNFPSGSKRKGRANSGPPAKKAKA